MAASLLEAVMPSYDVRTRHTTTVEAPPDRVGATVEAFRPAADGSPLTRILFRIRGLGVRGGSLREALTAEGFTPVLEDPSVELVFAVAGRFWSLRERAALVRVADADAARSFDRPGNAIAVFSVSVTPQGPGRTLLATETRVRCVDAAARRRFRAYWRIVGPFSGLIRRDWLRAIKRLAEAPQGGTSRQ